MPTKKVFLKNMVEDFVWDFMKQAYEKYPDACQCEVCTHDVAALALNELKPHYVVREEGEVYTKISLLESQYRADLLVAVTKAILRVQANPRH